MVSTAASQELMVPCVLALRLLLPWCHMQPLIQPGVQLVVANFPHNPTGTVLQQQDWKQLVSACQAAGAWLFSDEMYRFSGRHALMLGPGCAGPEHHCRSPGSLHLALWQRGPCALRFAVCFGCAFDGTCCSSEQCAAVAFASSAMKAVCPA
jgi:hypothetical protein